MVTYFPKPLNKQVAAISDSLTRTQEGLGIGASGDTHDAISSGQFVYVRDHSSLAEGLYKSTAAIAANGALSTSNLTADESGGLNDLQSQITSLNSNIICTGQSELLNSSIAQSSDTSWHNTSGSITIPANAKYLVLNVEPNGAMRQSLVIPVIMLRQSALDYYVNNYWDANDLGYLRIDRNGNYFVGAKTQNMKFNYSIHEIH